MVSLIANMFLFCVLLLHRMAIDKLLSKYIMAIKPTVKAQLPFYKKRNCHFMIKAQLSFDGQLDSNFKMEVIFFYFYFLNGGSFAKEAIGFLFVRFVQHFCFCGSYCFLSYYRSYPTQSRSNRPTSNTEILKSQLYSN